MSDAAALYRLLGDDVRLRLLRLLSRERLNVSELTAILGIAQSGVSRHLGLLKDAGLVREQREAGFAYYHFALDGPAGTAPSRRATAGTRAHAGPANGSRPYDDALRALLDAQFGEMGGTPAAGEDEARLQEVLRLRKENFDAHGTEGRQLVPGRSWAAWARAMGVLLPPLTVADLGCGEGYLTIEVARWAKRVVAVDRSAEVLRRARDLARRRRATNITWKRGEIEHLPLADASVDLAVLSQALHHAASPPVALSEASRIVVPGGRILVLDLRAHNESWVRTRLDDRWMGFADDELRDLLCGAGFEQVRVRVGARRSGDPFTVLVASGGKEAGLPAQAPPRPRAKTRGTGEARKVEGTARGTP